MARTTEQVEAFKLALAEGKPLYRAMLDAGYSEKVAKTGRRGLSDDLTAVLAEFDKAKEDANKLIAYRTQFSVNEMGTIVEARLLKNAVEGTDAGSMSAKTLGSHKDLKLWQPDVMVGVQVNNLPAGVEKLITVGED